jgi:hypothetical protein
LLLFHATPDANAVAILREGLIGTEEETFFGEEDGDPTEPYFKRVHLIESAEEALGWVAQLYGEDPMDITVFAVNVDGLELLPGLDGPSTYAVRDHVAADRLSIVHDAGVMPVTAGPDLWS